MTFDIFSDIFLFIQDARLRSSAHHEWCLHLIAEQKRRSLSETAAKPQLLR